MCSDLTRLISIKGFNSFSGYIGRQLYTDVPLFETTFLGRLACSLPVVLTKAEAFHDGDSKVRLHEGKQ